MPPVFAYFLILLLWIAVACLVWLTAVLMYLLPQTRILSWPLSLAMAGTFPFVFVYQAAVAPLVAVVLSITWASLRIIEPGGSTTTGNPIVIGLSVVAVLLSFGMISAMSLAGFYEGWRTGWECGKGRRLREVIWEGRSTKVVLHMLQKLRPKSPAS